MKFSGLVIATFAASISFASAAVSVSKPGTTTTAIHDAAGAGVTTGSGDYYASGNDDAFAEYGVTTFNFSSGDFGGGVTAIVGASLTLTVNDRNFADGNAVEVLFSSESSAGLASLGYDNTAVNGLNASQFTSAPISLGVFTIPEMAGRAGGEQDIFTLNVGSIGGDLVSAINAGSDFQILIAATDASHDITYSGVGNTFDPGDPTLSINAEPTPAPVVPEPSTGLLGLLGAMLLVVRRRR